MVAKPSKLSSQKDFLCVFCGTGMVLRGFIFTREARTNTDFVGLGLVDRCLRVIKHPNMTGEIVKELFR